MMWVPLSPLFWGTQNLRKPKPITHNEQLVCGTATSALDIPTGLCSVALPKTWGSGVPVKVLRGGTMSSSDSALLHQRV